MHYHNPTTCTCERCSTIRNYTAAVNRAEQAKRLTPEDGHRLRMQALRAKRGA